MQSGDLSRVTLRDDVVPSGPLLNLYNYIDSHVPRYIIITDILKLILKAQNIHISNRAKEYQMFSLTCWMS